MIGGIIAIGVLVVAVGWVTWTQLAALHAKVDKLDVSMRPVGEDGRVDGRVLELLEKVIAPQVPETAPQPEQPVGEYMDLGGGGRMDLDTDWTETNILTPRGLVGGLRPGQGIPGMVGDDGEVARTGWGEAGFSEWERESQVVGEVEGMEEDWDGFGGLVREIGFDQYEDGGR